MEDIKMEKNQGKTLTNNPMNISKLIRICHFILIIILVVIAGLHGINLIMNMAGAYQCLDDSCGVCESITGYTCEKPIRDTFCLDGDCIKINLTG